MILGELGILADNSGTLDDAEVFEEEEPGVSRAVASGTAAGAAEAGGGGF